MKTKIIVYCLVGILLLLAVQAARASVDAYALEWWSADSGGGASSNGSYQLSGAIGQPDAGQMAGGNYILSGGFWSGQTTQPLPQARTVYLPVICR